MPKLKNDGLGRDLVGGEGAARDLDHGAELVVEVDAGRLGDRVGLDLEEARG